MSIRKILTSLVSGRSGNNVAGDSQVNNVMSFPVLNNCKQTGNQSRIMYMGDALASPATSCGAQECDSEIFRRAALDMFRAFDPDDAA